MQCGCPFVYLVISCCFSESAHLPFFSPLCLPLHQSSFISLCQSVLMQSISLSIHQIFLSSSSPLLHTTHSLIHEMNSNYANFLCNFWHKWSIFKYTSKRTYVPSSSISIQGDFWFKPVRRIEQTDARLVIRPTSPCV
jgi:hypothetical protein